ncbi:hypothetical protein SEA_CASSIA_54 [Arthrobacter phage Cassia]|uniref:Uncharacterized protein n=1 Tax=Arthrobacter phage Cassia TaxID=2927275 RepID=A0AAF0K0G6_9CAUD|nr:hypothetical protein SEA_CASSIA_54 [Arthrobacter phage Cassia]
MSNPRFVPALATWTSPESGEKGIGPSYGVLDTLENTFAPFLDEGVGAKIGDALAAHAAETVAAKPEAGWDFVPDFELVPVKARFEWRRATYDRVKTPTTGVLDNELGRFAPFGYEGSGVNVDDVVASVALAPENYAYTSDYKLTD